MTALYRQRSDHGPRRRRQTGLNDVTNMVERSDMRSGPPKQGERCVSDNVWSLWDGFQTPVRTSRRSLTSGFAILGAGETSMSSAPGSSQPASVRPRSDSALDRPVPPVRGHSEWWRRLSRQVRVIVMRAISYRVPISRLGFVCTALTHGGDAVTQLLANRAKGFE